MKNTTLALCFIALVIAACSTKDTDVVLPDASPDLAVVADMAVDSPVDQSSPDQSTTPDQSVADLKD